MQFCLTLNCLSASPVLGFKTLATSPGCFDPLYVSDLCVHRVREESNPPRLESQLVGSCQMWMLRATLRSSVSSEYS